MTRRVIVMDKEPRKVTVTTPNASREVTLEEKTNDHTVQMKQAGRDVMMAEDTPRGVEMETRSVGTTCWPAICGDDPLANDALAETLSVFALSEDIPPAHSHPYVPTANIRSAFEVSEDDSHVPGALLTKTALSGKSDTHSHPYAAAFMIDTEQNILNSSATTVKLAFSSDTYKLFYANGTEWKEQPIRLFSKTGTPSMGYTEETNMMGVYPDAISNKRLSGCVVGGTNRGVNGELVFVDPYFYVRTSAGLEKVVTGFTFYEDVDGRIDLQHKPAGATGYYNVSNDTSVYTGLNGYPLVQDGYADMGCYPRQLINDAGLGG